MPGNKFGLAYSEGLDKIALDKKMSVGDLSPYANAIKGVYKAINGLLRKSL